MQFHLILVKNTNRTLKFLFLPIEKTTFLASFESQILCQRFYEHFTRDLAEIST